MQNSSPKKITQHPMNLNGQFPLTPAPLPKERGTSQGQGCIVFMGAMREKTLPLGESRGEGNGISENIAVKDFRTWLSRLRISTALALCAVPLAAGTQDAEPVSSLARSNETALAQPGAGSMSEIRLERQPLVVELWAGKAPDELGTIGPERERMSPSLDRKQVEVTESTRMLTDVTKPSITICRPAKDKDTGTAVLICPGGGYWNLYWQLEGEEVASWLNSLGATGIILKYRVPRRPDEPQGQPARRPLQDAQRAVSMVRSRAAEWGIDPKRIGIVGFSAGGHLAIATATEFERRTYEPIDAVDQVSCRPDFAILVYPGYLKAKDKDELAPGLRIPAGTPPVFLAHGGADIISPPEHSVLMYLALKKAGIPAELHVYATAAHDFGVRPSDHPCSTWTNACAAWLSHQGFLPLPQR
jgi:acetyl esterase/lipase